MTQLLVKQVIEGCTAGLPAQIKYYTQFNQCVKIIDDVLSEVICAAMNDTICGGTGGSGWDNEDGGEGKNSSHVQSKFCTCGKKVSFFSEKCPHCGGTHFKANKDQKNFDRTNRRDGRWGISAKSHFKWLGQLNEYRLTLVEPLTDDPSCREFRIRYWVIDKNSEHLNAYAQAQLDSDKSNHINFQPLKIDFYLSKPIKKFDGILTVHADRTEFNYTYFDLDNQTPEPIPTEYAGLTSQTVLESKKFNKERGEVGRN